MRLTSLPQRSVSPQGALTPAEHAKAARLSREMALYARVSGGTPTPPSRPLRSPGTAEFALAARRDYADLLDLYQAPRLSPSFVVQKWDSLPAPVGAAFDRFRAQHAGKAEIALSTIDGHRSWQAQVSQQGGAQVLLLDAKGTELGRGVARGASVAWR